MTTDELALARAPERAQVPIELVRRQKTGGAAFSLACSTSGLDDKEIYLQLAIDAGTFSKIKKGDATLQSEKMASFCHAVGNSIYPEWLAYQIGCTLVVIRTESERRADDAEKRAKEAEAKVLLLQNLLIGKAA